MHDERKQALIDADHRRLVRAAARLLGTADAEDVVQDAYVRALQGEVPALDATQAWLLTVVRNLAIDRLRRRQWMLRWLMEASGEAAPASPAAEMDAALRQDTVRALRLLVARLSVADGAVVLLHEVFEVGHAEIAQASGKSEAGSRQQLRRALVRLRQPGGAPGPRPESDPREEAVLRLYLHSLQLRDPRALWAMLRQPPISASLREPMAAAGTNPARPGTSCGIVQVGGQLGLALSLDGVTLCVVPLGVRPGCVPETVSL